MSAGAFTLVENSTASSILPPKAGELVIAWKGTVLIVDGVTTEAEVAIGLTNIAEAFKRVAA